MSFGTGLSGLNASAKNLDVIGHNIANANTTGMKAGRAEFAELYANSLGAAGGSNGGIGVAVATVSQQFTQGNLKTTGNNLDMAVNGEGFFKVAMTDGSTAYTRNGEFKLDQDGYIVTNAGAKLQGYAPSTPGGVIATGATQNLQLPTGGLISPKPTTEISIRANLDASAVPQQSGSPPVDIPLPTVNGDIDDAHKKYGTTVNAYDDLGNAIPVTVYYIKDAAANTWNQVVSMDGKTALDIQQIVFNAAANPATGAIAGSPVSTTAITPIVLAAAVPPAVVPSSALTLDFNYGADPDQWTLNQFGSAFSVFDINQDGYAAGEMTAIKTSEDGTISASYSNGITQSVGQVSLSRFRNVQGLTAMNGGYWSESATSGNPVEGQPQTGRFGQVREATLEESNVDMTAELVNMIVAQRSYQANAQTIKTQDQVLSTLVNLR